MEKKLYIGVDLGTSAVKLLLVDGEGAILNSETREYPLSFPHPGWSEQSALDWWTACTDGIRALLKEAQEVGIDPERLLLEAGWPLPE